MTVGLWQRFTMIFKAKASRTLDRVENPGETLDYSYQKQLEMLQKTKRGLADVVTAKKRLQHQTQGLEQSVVKLDGQARQAISAGRDDLARTALSAKLVQEQLQGPTSRSLARGAAAPDGRSSRFRRRSRPPHQKEVIKAQYWPPKRRCGSARRRRALIGLSDIGAATAGAGSGGADAGARVRRRGAGLDRRSDEVGSSGTSSLDRQIAALGRCRSMPSWTRSAPSWAGRIGGELSEGSPQQPAAPAEQPAAEPEREQ
jgi:phage shock protein A